MYKLPLVLLLLASSLPAVVPAPAHALVITELMAVNDTTVADDDGDFSDWLEIHNESGAPVNLAGYHLTDNDDDLTKWQFPGVTIGAGGYLLVWASDKDRSDPAFPLHTSFKLSGGGEYLALVLPDGVSVVADYAPSFPAQQADISYGLAFDLITERCFFDATPGAANDETAPCGAAGEVEFSPERGFYDFGFSATLSTSTPGAVIHYTLDGSAPSDTAGTLYSAPVPISTTTMLRAVSFVPGSPPAPVVTHTYLFLDDVLQQSIAGLPPEYPDKWGGGTGADYDMDPDVVNDPLYASTIKDDLQSIPTMSIVMDVFDLFDAENGFYMHTQGRGVQWERPASMELIYPDGSDSVQQNCGIRAQGGVSRFSGTKKHSMRLLFKSLYGPSKLEHRLFPDGPVDRFDTVVLTAGHNNAWIAGQASSQYVRDTFSKDLQIEAGQPGLHSTYVHLYLNGIYWGLYRPTERPDASYMAERFGGDKDTDYDAINAGKINDGDKDAWDITQALANAGLESSANYNTLLEYVDAGNLIDYMLVNFYIGNYDWDFHNWRAARRRQLGAGWKFFSWDAELTMSTVNSNRTGVHNHDDPSAIYDDLRQESVEFQTLFGDHAHRHMFNGGIMTPLRAAELYLRRASEIDRAIVGESARWGDKEKSTPHTRDREWLVERQRLLHAWFPIRTDIALDQLRRKDLYPDHVAPVFNQHGGDFDDGFALSMTAPAGIVYYTDDGSDPRLPGGAISPSAQTYSAPFVLAGSVSIKARSRVGTEWSALADARFVRATSLRVTELMYHPTLGPGYEFIELRNVGSDPVQLAGVSLVDGVDFTFPSTVVAPGAHVVVVEDLLSFEALYGAGLPVAGVYEGRLDNGGERVALADAGGDLILAFTYDDAWYPSTDGGGRSLLIRDDAGAKASWGEASAWRASTFAGGSAATAELPICADGVDNDGDGPADFPADAGCDSAAADIEDPQCDDGLDNDDDGLLDAADPDCATASEDREGPEPVNGFVCYQARTSSGTDRFEAVDVSLDDALEDVRQYTARRTKALCLPAEVNGAPVLDVDTVLQSYDAKLAAGEKVEHSALRFESDFGPIIVDTSKADRLLVPASVDVAGGGPVTPPAIGSHAVDHYKCYRTRVTSGTPKYFPSNAQGHAIDELEDRDYRLKPPRRVCVPVDMSGNGIKNADGYLMCYPAKNGKFSPKHVRVLGIDAASGLGEERLDTRKEEEVCVPAALAP